MDLIRAVQHSHLPVLSWRPALSSTSSPLHRFPKLCDVGKSCIPFRTSTSVSSRSHVRIRTLPVHAQIAAPVRIVQQAFLQFPPSWTSSLIANATIFTIGLPILQTGLTASGMASAYLLGTSTWRAFGASGFLVVAAYFVLGTAVTKVKIKQKEKEGIAEKRSGKRGPASVWGSGLAGMFCALAAIVGLGGVKHFQLWQLGFVASFATKLSDTVSSEIGKAFGRTTYLVTTLKPVQRGTEGAISLEGTGAGLVASILLSLFAYRIHQVTIQGAAICIVASQLANLFESYAGATLQDTDGLKWLNNDVINVLNISFGAALAILFQKINLL
ncbi:hypothetical protein KP509_30G040700 [Ceratopteris richardii]|uniref:Uncharacterized protein n=1 Tax=Ceratopteris richardii TaxID=49495 RepID=A0A8T2R3B6_CERRI|nr:hypothetical protein KP509_30G040700 [Ceratopteris richardii]